MIETIIVALWYFLPAGMGNMTPVITAKAPLLRKWQTPIDGGKFYNGKRVFGPHKTWRGLTVGVLAGMLTGAVQSQFTWVIEGTSLPDIAYSGFAPVILGGLLAFGALAGDAIESFAKRQHGVASGESWFPFDQTDYIIGACLLGALLLPLSFVEYIAIFAIWFGLHLVSSYVGYLLKFKAKPI